MHSWLQCPKGYITDIRSEAILSTSFGSCGTARHRQVTCTCQIWILPHFDVRTISVASKLKELQIFLYYWQKIIQFDTQFDRSKNVGCIHEVQCLKMCISFWNVQYLSQYYSTGIKNNPVVGAMSGLHHDPGTLGCLGADYDQPPLELSTELRKISPVPSFCWLTLI